MEEMREGSECCQSGNNGECCQSHQNYDDGECCQSHRGHGGGCCHSHNHRIEGIQNHRTLDAIAYDTNKNEFILAMYEVRPWTHGHNQLYQLQEKLNTYASYILDGEMAEDFPEYPEPKVRIQLRTVDEPSDSALEFIHQARKQLELQDVTLEVIQISTEEEALIAANN